MFTKAATYVRDGDKTWKVPAEEDNRGLSQMYLVHSRSNSNPHKVIWTKKTNCVQCDKACVNWSTYTLCSHCLTIAEINGILKGFLQWFKNRKRTTPNLTGLINVNMPQNAGEKPTSKNRKGRANKAPSVGKTVVSHRLTQQSEVNISTHFTQPSTQRFQPTQSLQLQPSQSLQFTQPSTQYLPPSPSIQSTQPPLNNSNQPPSPFSPPNLTLNSPNLLHPSSPPNLTLNSFNQPSPFSPPNLTLDSPNLLKPSSPPNLTLNNSNQPSPFGSLNLALNSSNLLNLSSPPNLTLNPFSPLKLVLLLNSCNLPNRFSSPSLLVNSSNLHSPYSLLNLVLNSSNLPNHFSSPNLRSTSSRQCSLLSTSPNPTNFVRLINHL